MKDGPEVLFKICITARVILYALIPLRRAEAGRNGTAVEISEGRIIVDYEDIRFYLGDMNRGITSRGELRLLIPGCFALAAPFLLFRLKREGFSNSRAQATGEGLFLSATR